MTLTALLVIGSIVAFTILLLVLTFSISFAMIALGIIAHPDSENDLNGDLLKDGEKQK